ncbi:MAG: nucleotide pyrophosphohydrolase [Spirochaetota bacterium]
MQQEMSITTAQKTVDDWIQTYGVRYYSELTNLAILMEETGELAKLMARTYGDQSFKESDKTSSIEGEMGDIFFVLICLANQMGLSLQDCLQNTLDKINRRDKERHINNEKLKN